MTPAERLDRIYRAYNARQITREAAVERMRAIERMSTDQAEELLDHERLPSWRYEGVR
jgi:hypothetical protein